MGELTQKLKGLKQGLTQDAGNRKQLTNNSNNRLQTKRLTKRAKGWEGEGN